MIPNAITKERRKTPKRRRTRLAKAELLMLLAQKAETWRSDIAGETPGILPFEEWGADDPFVTIARTYHLTNADLAKILDTIGDQIEDRAVRGGFDETWRDD